MKNFLKIQTSILLILLSLFQSTLVAFATSAPDQSGIDAAKRAVDELLVNEEFGNCKNVLSAKFDIETISFLKFLEENFENKSSTSTLTKTAIARYRTHRDLLRSIYLTLTPTKSEGVSFEKALESYAECQKITEAYIQVAKEKMISHVRSTSVQKQTTVMIEKYKSINGKVRDMHLAVAKMYGLYVTFKNKLPGFIQQCIKK